MNGALLYQKFPSRATLALLRLAGLGDYPLKALQFRSLGFAALVVTVRHQRPLLRRYTTPTITRSNIITEKSTVWRRTLRHLPFSTKTPKNL